MPEPLKHLAEWLSQRWPYTVTGVLVLVFLVAKSYPVVKGWLGFKKDVLDLKKTGLEVKKLEKEELLVKPASLDDVKKYDPKVRTLDRIFSSEWDTDALRRVPSGNPPLSWSSRVGCFVVSGVSLVLLYVLATYLFHVFFGKK